MLVLSLGVYVLCKAQGGGGKDVFAETQKKKTVPQTCHPRLDPQCWKLKNDQPVDATFGSKLRLKLCSLHFCFYFGFLFSIPKPVLPCISQPQCPLQFLLISCLFPLQKSATFERPSYHPRHNFLPKRDQASKQTIASMSAQPQDQINQAPAQPQAAYQTKAEQFQQSQQQQQQYGPAAQHHHQHVGATPLQSLGPAPAVVDCPFCQQRVMTRVNEEHSSMT